MSTLAPFIACALLAVLARAVVELSSLERHRTAVRTARRKTGPLGMWRGWGRTS